ncbi:hypothetical protein, unlikely [Trypanosoma brucei gambiense DAL972]|uniref:Uncharacterized protein n=1 Tax=Trypanosoma brucei gambiense (strain MHOM/CI/86/DAL972) TaxID=679716 RepID=C9ZS32_TRYB9|nr:hypothetical protein, unlikely [Trypanosoma brucei gambiense DAL972]CBH12168.1 hypothetical protein, unlikely [Trypanosoma brucei gambiense DAL972]|eukprot:XP_011774451.1 hypothetical protein, unlikely [Trypanosoma brucei gambiense DAL972]
MNPLLSDSKGQLVYPTNKVTKKKTNWEYKERNIYTCASLPSPPKKTTKQWKGKWKSTPLFVLRLFVPLSVNCDNFATGWQVVHAHTPILLHTPTCDSFPLPSAGLN